MIVAVADTHTLVWYLHGDPRLSNTARNFIEGVVNSSDQIAVSAITFVELVYLIEKGRLPAQQFTQLADEVSNPQSQFIEIPLNTQIARALTRVDVRQVPDIPDRIIAATAVHHQVSVISRDAKIQLSRVSTVW